MHRIRTVLSVLVTVLLASRSRATALGRADRRRSAARSPTPRRRARRRARRSPSSAPAGAPRPTSAAQYRLTERRRRARPRPGADDRLRAGGAAGDGRGREPTPRPTSCWCPAWPSSRRWWRSATGPSSRGELSTSVSSVSAADLVGQPIASVDGALQGKAPGVQVIQNAGNPGNAISVRVRGLASISASNDPLYVVDGVPMIAGESESARRGRPGRGGDQRPQPRRRRDGRRAEGRRGHRDLRLARLQRRGADHDQARPGRAHDGQLQQLRRHPVGVSPAARCSTRSSISSTSTRARSTTATARTTTACPGWTTRPTPTGRTACSARRR